MKRAATPDCRRGAGATTIQRRRRRSLSLAVLLALATGTVAVAQEELPPVRGGARSTTPARRVRSARRRGGQRRPATESSPLVYQYLGREIRQIGIITSLIVAILVALTFVLR